MLRLTALLLVAFAVSTNGHGRFMKPPNRSSIWRIPEFQHLGPPSNYVDNELFCGGLHQSEVVGGNCGICGDPYLQATPRDNEIGGLWYRGIITGQYTAGQEIEVEVELTAAHLGYMEWRLCDNPSTETQECFNRNLLQRADGQGSKLPVTGGSGWYRTTLVLPPGVTCEHGIIQWNYRTGNAWGDCGNSTSNIGCGPQETFRGCSDVSIS